MLINSTDNGGDDGYSAGVIDIRISNAIASQGWAENDLIQIWGTTAGTDSEGDPIIQVAYAQSFHGNSGDTGNTGNIGTTGNTGNS
jgi:hypothetical protein